MIPQIPDIFIFRWMSNLSLSSDIYSEIYWCIEKRKKLEEEEKVGIDTRLDNSGIELKEKLNVDRLHLTEQKSFSYEDLRSYRGWDKFR